MISVLICGYNPQHEISIKENIFNTIGAEHEVIYYKNEAQKGIAEVYNILKAKAKGDIICFVHEDVEFLTHNWGLEVERIFKDKNDIGLLGIAGGKYVSRNLIPIKEVQNLIQGYKFSNEADRPLVKFDADLEKVVNLDGVLLFSSKRIASAFDFDENLLKAFHGYDIDYCLQVAQQHQNYFTSKILIKHFSEGKFDKEWVTSLKKVQMKWATKLPKFVEGLKYIDREMYEYKIFWAGLERIGGMRYIIQNFRLSFLLVFLYKKTIKQFS